MGLVCDEENLCIFVANLPFYLNELEIVERLKVIFGRFGKVSSVKTSFDAKNRPFAFVQFEGPVIDFLLTEIVMIEDRILRFERARSPSIPDKANSMSKEIDDKGVILPEQFPSTYYPMPQYAVPFYGPMNPGYPQLFPVYPAAPYSSSYPCNVESTNAFDEEANKVYISRLNGELITQRKLLRRFQQYGHITDIELFKNNLDGSLRQEAFAFISYLKPEQMLNAINAENGREWLNRRLKCCRALKKREKPENSSKRNVESEGDCLEQDGEVDLEIVTGNI